MNTGISLSPNKLKALEMLSAEYLTDIDLNNAGIPFEEIDLLNKGDLIQWDGEKQVYVITEMGNIVLAEHGKHPFQNTTPKIVCLCGSTRFSAAYQNANLLETLAGNIVLTIGCDMRTDAELFADKTPEELEQIKAQLDELHLRKIDLADEVLILNVDGYIGSSTQRELAYAESHGKRVRFLVAR